ncbi:nitroreductase [Caulobacter ginsengisoli]|uniref:Putative NAD(P)H nitroreductase n=1 Tax=Caulobacter ginsengisoli TaxID=400775 RepID=A0ABU0IMW6_9CAUL|nr:nitroreductase [Caulobacter ginsengisoli]MDQ0462493.1 nitroreductase [Caulobacter ginsengisoli]
MRNAPAFGDPLPQPATPEVLDFLARRRSSSALSLQAPGPSAAQLDELLTLAARVPDHGKLSPWRFVVLEGAGKTAFAEKLEALAEGREDGVKLKAKLAKLKTPPMGVAVISRYLPGDIPEWEQRLSAAAVCLNLLYAATAMGFGANWITDWYAYDAEANAVLGLGEGEKVAGFVFIGQAGEVPLERVRPDVSALVSRWGDSA